MCIGIVNITFMRSGELVDVICVCGKDTGYGVALCPECRAYGEESEKSIANYAGFTPDPTKMFPKPSEEIPF